MIRYIINIILLGLVGLTAANAQSAVVDIPQTILIEGNPLKVNIITHETTSTLFSIELLDSKGQLLDQQMLEPQSGLNTYGISLPELTGSAWLVIRNGAQAQAVELLILERPKQLLKIAKTAQLDTPISELIPASQPNEKICLDDINSDLIYLSSTDTMIQGQMLLFQEVVDHLRYPITIASGHTDQVFFVDATTFTSLKTEKGAQGTQLILTSAQVGAHLLAVNKLTNLPEHINYNYKIDTQYSHSLSTLSSEDKTWLANQLLISELLTPINEDDFSKISELTTSTLSWLSALGSPTVNLDPRSYVAYDDIKSFLSELARTLRLYPSEIKDYNYGSYLYAIQEKPSFRQPLYLIDGAVSTIDVLLSLEQNEVSNIQIYSNVKKLTNTLGPIASAGLVIVNTIDNSTTKNQLKLGGKFIKAKLASVDKLCPVSYIQAPLQNCYQHNKRLGVFNINGVSIDDNQLTLHQQRIHIKKTAQ